MGLLQLSGVKQLSGWQPMQTIQEPPRSPHRKDDETGVTVVEYAIILMVIALAVAGFGLGFRGSVVLIFSRLVSALSGSS